MSKNKERRLPYWFALIVVLGLISCFFAIKKGWTPLKRSDQSAPVVISEVSFKDSEPRGGAESIPTDGVFDEIYNFRFLDTASLKNWEQKIFKGATQYEIKSETDKSFLRSRSQNACSGLFMKIKQNPTEDLYLSWKWRVLAFPKKKNQTNLSDRSQDDFGARVYVIFEASNLFRSDVVEYIWDESLPVGISGDSPYSDRIKLLVIRSGKDGVGEDGWSAETRNPLKDYEKLFGRKPKHPIGIIALMSDSDNTGSSASADFADIVFKIKKAKP